MDEIYFAGVEGGATQSVLIISNGAGEILGKAHGESSNHWMIGIPEVAKRINAMACEAKANAKIPQSTKLKCIGLSLSGCEQESTNAALEREIRHSYPNLAENYVVCSDTMGSIMTISNLGGLVVIAGTGSNAVLRNPNGETFQCGGWGHQLGDEGGAWFISQKLVKTVFDHEDNLEKCTYDITTAWKLIKNHFKIDTRVDMLEHCYAKFNKSFYAKLCQKMSVAALDGDELCKSIFNEAGRLLAKMIVALLPKISPELVKTGYLNVICVGSVWISWNLLKTGFIKELEKHNILFELRLLRLKSNISMAIGSVYMAADSVKFPLPRDYEENYEIFFNFNGNCEHLNLNNNIL
ncbi:hypothetical protein PVAND_001595 [Polypedilum vanderplanki]|uniref:N-acetyl-D-glucosamine kinase n=1 Tax=Polypedilum vanderplanki TaxID=319348 RepID=A0A9J6BNW4_POLVA|nr:hypothetical protein PVAND_001595 [Polypedilum vanderplanki]